MLHDIAINGGKEDYIYTPTDDDGNVEFLDENRNYIEATSTSLLTFLPLIFPLDFFRTLGPQLEKNNGDAVIPEIVADENYTTIHAIHDIYHGEDYENSVLLDIELNGLDPEKMENGQYFLNEYGAKITSSGNNHTEFRHTQKYQEDVANSAICSMAICYAYHIFRLTIGRVDSCYVRISCDGIDGATGHTIDNYLLSVKFEPADFKKMNLRKIDPIEAIDSLESTRKSISSNKKIKFVFDEDDWSIQRGKDDEILWGGVAVYIPYMRLGGEGCIMNNLSNQWKLFLSDLELPMWTRSLDNDFCECGDVKFEDHDSDCYIGESTGKTIKYFENSTEDKIKENCWWDFDDLEAIDKLHEKVKSKVFSEEEWKNILHRWKK